MSNPGIIIHLDNDQKKLDEFKSLYNQLDIDLELISCTSKKEFNDAIEKHRKNLQSLIFDLLSSEPGTDELHEKDAEFLDSIKSSFANLNIPIFIYSGFLEAIEGKFEEHGTVFKIDKADGPDDIFSKVQLFKESGFLDIFCPGGKIEREIHKELHRAFISQFTNNSQIESIIEQISEAGGDVSQRVENVFKRIAISSLLSGLKAPKADESGEVERPELVHPVEHYIQRISPFDFWTGDILRKESEDELLLVLTPRCNVVRSDELLVCEIDNTDFPKSKDGVRRALRDNPDISGYDRYLAPSPFFDGGRVKLSTHRIESKTVLSSDYKRVISLSPELTNEILGKFGAYFFRTGITPWNEVEAMVHLGEAKDG